MPEDCPLAGPVEGCAENDPDFSSGLPLDFVQVQLQKKYFWKESGYNRWRVAQEVSRPMALNCGCTPAASPGALRSMDTESQPQNPVQLGLGVLVGFVCLFV